MSEKERGFRWGHVNINVRDLDTSVEFYRKLGFEIFIPGVPYLALSNDVAAQPLPSNAAEALGLEGNARGRACIMQLDEGFPKIDLTEFAGLNQNKPLGNSDLGLVRICLVTENLQSDVERLKAEGIEFISEPKAGHMGLVDMAVCRDPDGSLIELLQVYMERWEPLLGTE